MGNAKTRLLQPGYLVSLHTSIMGGISYVRTDLDTGLVVADGAKVDRWETERRIDDPEDYTEAVRVRNAASSAIRAACAKTPFGLLCPLATEGDLDAAIAEARRIVGEYNARENKSSEVRFWALKGKIADNDEAAAGAIANELQETLARMNRAIKDLDPKAIREAVSEAKQLAATLSAESAGKVESAMQVARDAARAITRRVQKNGEDAAAVLADIDSGPIEAARMAFLDFDDAAPIEALPSINLQRFDGIEDDNTSTAPMSLPSVAEIDASETVSVVGPRVNQPAFDF